MNRAAAIVPPAKPVIVVHTIAHALGALKAAARAGRPIVLVSAPEAGIYAGPGWFRGLIAAARATAPDARCAAMLDCGEEAGAALAAIRARVEGVVFTGSAEIARRLADIAGQAGVGFATERPAAALDLGADFFADEATIEQRCADFLLRSGARGCAPPPTAL